MAKPGQYRIKVLGLRGQVIKTLQGRLNSGPQTAQANLSCDGLPGGLIFVAVEIDYDDGTHAYIKPTKESVAK
jgi:hypothetical protein